MREYLLVLSVAVAVTYLVSALCRRLAFRTGALARVRDRDVHTIEMPYFGGIAMLAGVAAAVALSWTLPFLGGHHGVLHRALLQRGQLRGRARWAGDRGGRHRCWGVLRLLLSAHGDRGP